MLSEPCVNITIGRVTELLTSMNMWTASNAALVLARYVQACNVSKFKDIELQFIRLPQTALDSGCDM